MSGIFPGSPSGPNDALSAPTLPIIVFDSVASISIFSMAITLAPAVLDTDIRRRNAWYNMIFNLMVFPLFYLLNVGHQFVKSSPPFGPCLLQAMSIYAAPPLGTAAVGCYITDVAIGLRAALYKKTINAKVAKVLLFLPMTVFVLVFLIEIMALRTTNLLDYDSAGMFCTAGEGTVHSRFSAGLTIVLLFVMLCMEVWIFVMLFRNWRTFKTLRTNHKDLCLSVYVRFGIFTLLVGGSGTLSALLLPENQSTGALWNIFLVSVPLIAGITFGTHRDLLSVWVSWILCKPRKRFVYQDDDKGPSKAV